MTSEPPPSDEIDEAIDWRGKPVLCQSCSHLGLRTLGKCQPLRACVFDRYARRIDRFFDWNPELGSQYVKHPYFEVRACAAKTAEVFMLPALLGDPEEAVRWSAARRLPKRYLLKLRQDAHREVRIRVAQRIEPEDLPAMMFDDDYAVRQIVARCVAAPLLAGMICDPDVEVRRVVAQRIPPSGLAAMAGDDDAAVRVEAAQRLDPASLVTLVGDPDWRVRYEVARRAPAPVVKKLLEDSDPIVRETAQERERDDATRRTLSISAAEENP